MRIRQGDEVPATSGTFAGAPDATTSLPSGAVLEFSGAPDDPTQRRLLRVVEQQLDAAVEHRELTRTAVDAERIAAADRVRSAILAAVGHDVRRPIAAASAAVQTLHAADIELSPADREALLTTADESLRQLAGLLADLLDVSRVQAGVLAVTRCRPPSRRSSHPHSTNSSSDRTTSTSTCRATCRPSSPTPCCCSASS